MTDGADNARSAENTERQRPAYKFDLLQEAIEAEEPVTEIDWSDSGRDLRVHAIQEYDGVAWRCTVKDHVEFDDTPTVSFAKSHWDSDVHVMCDWSSLATGRLSGPQTLPAWESLFTVFNAALGEYYREVGILGSSLRGEFSKRSSMSSDEDI